MSDRKPDELLRDKDCPHDWWNCRHMKETGGGMEGEQYHCDLCRAAYYLDYEDMK